MSTTLHDDAPAEATTDTPDATDAPEVEGPVSVPWMDVTLRSLTRRDMRALAAAVTALTRLIIEREKSDPLPLVSVLLHDDRYGVHRLTGELRYEAATQTLVLAGETVAVKGKPQPHVHAIGEPDDDRYEPHAPEVLALDPMTVGHGDVLTARFEQSRYGRFTVTGTGVLLGERSLSVGRWLVVGNGQPGTLLCEVTACADFADDLPMPEHSQVVDA